MQFFGKMAVDCGLTFYWQDRNIRFEALQSEAGKNLLRRSGRAPDDISSVVLVEKERCVM